jgi:hypothetical protein
VNFVQSTFLGSLLSRAALKQREERFVPQASEALRIDQFCLSQIDGENSLERIAKEVADRYPDRFRCWEDALSHVADLAERYNYPSDV